jgi:predicted Zn-dependent peptidase
MIDYKLKTFPNGLRLVTAPLESTEAVTILIYVGVGGRYELEDQSGISHFLEHLFFKGSTKRPSAFEISSELDGIGANYNAFTGEEATAFYVQSASTDFTKAFDVISDMFLHPLFDQEELNRERGVIIQEANMYRDMPQAHVQILNQEQIFPDQPLGRNLVGTPEAIEKITSQDIKKYNQAHYNGRNTIVAICGKITGDIEKIVEKTFRDLPKGDISIASDFDKTKKPVSFVQEKRKIDQTHFALSFISPKKDDKKKYALAVLNTVLGGGMSSRLFTEIREKRGLGYYIKSGASQYLDTGATTIFGGVKPEEMSTAMKVIEEILLDLKSNGPTKDELDRAKGNLRGQLALSLEESFEIASYLVENLHYYHEIRDPKKAMEEVEKITTAQVRDLAREIFVPGKSALTIVGPKTYEIKSNLID